MALGGQETGVRAWREERKGQNNRICRTLLLGEGQLEAQEGPGFILRISLLLCIFSQ